MKKNLGYKTSVVYPREGGRGGAPPPLEGHSKKKSDCKVEFFTTYKPTSSQNVVKTLMLIEGVR